jgi:hypothetical protein
METSNPLASNFELPKPSTSASRTFDPLGFFILPTTGIELTSSSSERREGTSGFNGKFVNSSLNTGTNAI